MTDLPHAVRDAIDEANRMRLRAIETGHAADEAIADYYVRRVSFVAEVERMAERVRRRLEERGE